MRATAVPAYRVSHMSPLRIRGMPRSAGQPAPQEPSRPSKMASASQAAGKADKQAHKAPERDRRRQHDGRCGVSQRRACPAALPSPAQSAMGRLSVSFTSSITM